MIVVVELCHQESPLSDGMWCCKTRELLVRIGLLRTEGEAQQSATIVVQDGKGKQDSKLHPSDTTGRPRMEQECSSSHDRLVSWFSWGERKGG